MIVNRWVSNITLFRNPNGDEHDWTRREPHLRAPANPLKVIIAEVGYIAVIPFAVVETALWAVEAMFESVNRHFFGGYSPVDPSRLFMTSCFTVCWAITNIFTNLFCNDLLVSEVNVWESLKEGNIFQAPRNLAPRYSSLDET